MLVLLLNITTSSMMSLPTYKIATGIADLIIRSSALMRVYQ